MKPKTVGLILFERIAADELSGPGQAFFQARVATSDDREFRCYQVLTLGIGTGRCLTECGIIVRPQLDISNAPQLDTIIVPGGCGIRDPRTSKKIARWLSRRAPATRRIVALGDSIYPLAQTGLLDGRQVAVHWHFAKDVAQTFPKLRVISDRLFVKDDRFYTCAGGISAVDLSLALIEEDYGRQLALKVARRLVVHVKRSGEQEQCSEALQFQIQSCDRFADVFSWILCHLNEDLSIEALARRTYMSPRNFTRLFKAEFGRAPAEFVTSVRITEARRRLLIPRNSIESVAASVGFKSADAFSRTFERLVGIRPSAYRGRRGVVQANFQKRQNAFGISSPLVRA
ncbi:MAG: helix-turn-helix domain-containing protein [Verrucomicrobia bacterium]|nr:helix-turn-helix domain-containing protein [Verrucomicrobiota bacterium]